MTKGCKKYAINHVFFIIIQQLLEKKGCDLITN